MERISVTTSEAGDITESVPVSVVQVTLPTNSSVVQSMIQQNPTILHTASGQALHAIQVKVGSDGETITLAEDDDSRRRRDILSRRPSYRKILNDLSSEPNNLTVAKIEEESSDGQNSQDSTDGNSAGGDNPAYVPIQLSSDGAGLQTLTMTNVNSSSPSSSAAAPTVLQYAAAQGADGQFFIPAGNIQYQLAPGTSLGGGVVMATTGGGSSPGGVPEEASRKRELRLLKNREAARECRRKKKDYIKCLENRVALLENQNKTLIEELKSLKELYCQKEVQQ